MNANIPSRLVNNNKCLSNFLSVSRTLRITFPTKSDETFYHFLTSPNWVCSFLPSQHEVVRKYCNLNPNVLIPIPLCNATVTSYELNICNDGETNGIINVGRSGERSRSSHSHNHITARLCEIQVFCQALNCQPIHLLNELCYLTNVIPIFYAVSVMWEKHRSWWLWWSECRAKSDHLNLSLRPVKWWDLASVGH